MIVKLKKKQIFSPTYSCIHILTAHQFKKDAYHVVHVYGDESFLLRTFHGYLIVSLHLSTMNGFSYDQLLTGSNSTAADTTPAFSFSSDAAYNNLPPG